MEAAIRVMLKYLRDPRTFLYSSLIGVGGIIAFSQLFFRGVREAVNSFRAKEWKCFWRGLLKCVPMILCTAVTVASIFAMHSIQSQAISEASNTISRLSTVSTPVVAGIGEKVVETISDNAEEKKSDPPFETKNDEPREINNTDYVEIVDTLSGVHFHSSLNRVQEQINEFNATLLDGEWRPLNDLYYYLGIPENVLGDNVGWQVTSKDDLVKVRFSAGIDNGKPIVNMVFRVEPKPARSW